MLIVGFPQPPNAPRVILAPLLPSNPQTRMRAQITLATPGTGDPLECVLLEKKTRKGGWKAKFLKRGAKGPTMNSAEVPKSAKPGQVIHLGVGVISDDGKRVQFHWHAHNADCR